jgi:hypothetical protein
VCAEKVSAAMVTATTVSTAATVTVTATTCTLYCPTTAAMAVTMGRGAVDPGDSGVDMDGIDEGPNPMAPTGRRSPRPLFSLACMPLCEVSALAGSSCV